MELLTTLRFDNVTEILKLASARKRMKSGKERKIRKKGSARKRRGKGGRAKLQLQPASWTSAMMRTMMRTLMGMMMMKEGEESYRASKTSTVKAIINTRFSILHIEI